VKRSARNRRHLGQREVRLGIRPCFLAIQVRRVRWPTAIQMPISRVWLLTEWAIAEKGPIAAKGRPSTPKAADSRGHEPIPTQCLPHGLFEPHGDESDVDIAKRPLCRSRSQVRI
jgi:hypothetical protein